MREKGFTLAEILGVIVIIGLLLILIVPTILNRLNSTKDSAKGANEDIIYNAADQYIREHPSKYPPGKAGRYCISIQDLIDDGKLVAPVKDVSTGEDISDRSVMVTIYSTGTSDYEIRDGDDCSAIASLPMIDFEVTPRGSNWVPKRTVKIIWPVTNGDYRVRYRINKGEWIYVDTIDSKVGGNIEIVFDQSSASTPLEAQYIGKGEDSSTSNIISSKINIVNIDSVAPTCTLRKTGTAGDNGWYTSNVTIDFGNNNGNLNDNLSGVEDYGISTSDVNTFGGINRQIQTNDVADITYYGFVKDKAGNIGKCSTALKKDATKPTCSLAASGTVGANNWYTSNVKFVATNSDNLSELASYGMNNQNKVNYDSKTQMELTTDSKSIVYYGFVKDKAGNTASCSKSVKRDATPPTCNVSKSNTGTTAGVTVNYNCNDSISGVVSCPAAKTGQKGNVAAITIKDNAGNNGTCAGATITATTQYRKRTRSAAQCTNSCCGTSTTYYVCGTTCTQYACKYYWIGETQGGGPSYRTKYYASCPSVIDHDWYLMSKTCSNSQNKYCPKTVNKTCTSATCCGYTSWSGWSGWGTGNYCNSSTCTSESRVVYG